MHYHFYMTPEDEPPLLEFIRETGGLVIHIFSPVWPPVPLASPPETRGEDECLAIWYPDIISAEELQHPDCRPELGPHGCYDAWSLPLVTLQRQWYWKRQGTILAVELDYRAFRPNRPDEAVFTDEEIADFTRRLDRLVEYAVAIEAWCVRRLRNGYIGEGAWRESESLRSMTDVRWPGFRGATGGQDENTPWD